MQRSGQPCTNKHERSRNAKKCTEDVCDGQPFPFTSEPCNPLGSRDRNLPQPGDAIDDDNAQQIVEKVRKTPLVCRLPDRRGLVARGEDAQEEPAGP